MEDPHVPGFPLRFLVKGHYPHGDAVQNLGFVHLNKQFMDYDEFTLHTIGSIYRLS